MSYLPSKNFIVIVSSGLLVMFMGFFVVNIWQNPLKWKNEPPTFSNASFEDAYKNANEDSDSDLLKNWEEILWKTDPNNKDSDNDGTPDGEEIKQGRDPGLAGPHDLLQKPEDIVKNDDNAKTLTEKIAREFALKYLASKGFTDGKPLSSSLKSSLSNALVLDIEKSASAYKNIFAIEDVKISEASEVIDQKKYLNRLGNILKENFQNISESELDILQAIIDEKDYAKSADFNEYLEAYKETVKFLRAESAPAAYANLHLAVLNIMQNTIYAVENMKQIENDPARAAIGVKLYLQEVDRSRHYLSALKNQTQKNGVAFNDGEDGAYFNKYFERL